MRLATVALAMTTLAFGARGEELHLTTHPLVGTIADVADGRVIDRGALEAILTDADFVILGEKHDNARHHAIQAELVDTLGAAGRLRTVAFEMFPRDRQLAITRHLQAGGSAAALAAAVDWADLGWGPWTWYGPIVHAAVDHGAIVTAADLDGTEVRAVYRDGFDVFSDPFVERTGLGEALAADDQAAREAAMVEAHCGHALGDGATSMVAVQRARDAMMADRLATLAGREQGVLVTGNGHADVGLGVPPVLARLRPNATVVSLGLVEVEPDWTEVPADLPFDYVWLTARAKPVEFDYCADLNPWRG